MLVGLNHFKIIRVKLPFNSPFYSTRKVSLTGSALQIAVSLTDTHGTVSPTSSYEFIDEKKTIIIMIIIINK